MGGLLIVGVAGSMLINWLALDNKVDVPDYPGSEKATLTTKGTAFIDNKYTADKPGSDYYKVMLTADNCEKVLSYYSTEAAKKDWIKENQDSSAEANILADSYKKTSRGLFIYCVPGVEQLAQNAGSNNIIVILTAGNVIELYPSTGLIPKLNSRAGAVFSGRLY